MPNGGRTLDDGGEGTGAEAECGVSARGPSSADGAPADRGPPEGQAADGAPPVAPNGLHTVLGGRSVEAGADGGRVPPAAAMPPATIPLVAALLASAEGPPCGPCAKPPAENCGWRWPPTARPAAIPPTGEPKIAAASLTGPNEGAPPPIAQPLAPPPPVTGAAAELATPEAAAQRWARCCSTACSRALRSAASGMASRSISPSRSACEGWEHAHGGRPREEFQVMRLVCVRCGWSRQAKRVR